MPTITYDGHSWLVESAGTNYSRDDQHDMRVRFWCAARRIMLFNRLPFSPQDFEKASTDDLTRSLAAVLRLSAHSNCRWSGIRVTGSSAESPHHDR